MFTLDEITRMIKDYFGIMVIIYLTLGGVLWRIAAKHDKSIKRDDLDHGLMLIIWPLVILVAICVMIVGGINKVFNDKT